MLKAGQWLNEGHDVYVVSTYSENAAASFYLYEALSQKYSSKQVGKDMLVAVSIRLSC